MLKKQLDEKEKQLAAEQDDAVAAKSRLREMTKVELCYSYLVQLMKRHTLVSCIPRQNERKNHVRTFSNRCHRSPGRPL